MSEEMLDPSVLKRDPYKSQVQIKLYLTEDITLTAYQINDIGRKIALVLRCSKHFMSEHATAMYIIEYLEVVSTYESFNNALEAMYDYCRIARIKVV